MATFTGDPDESTRLDWRILQNGAICLYFRRRILDEDIAWLREQGYEVHEFDCSRWASESDFHADVSRDLGFPAWYGHNLHAFNDSLGDLVVPDLGASPWSSAGTTCSWSGFRPWHGTYSTSSR